MTGIVYFCAGVTGYQRIAETQHTFVLSLCEDGAYQVNKAFEQHTDCASYQIHPYIVDTYRACVKAELENFQRDTGGKTDNAQMPPFDFRIENEQAECQGRQQQTMPPDIYDTVFMCTVQTFTNSAEQCQIEKPFLRHMRSERQQMPENDDKQIDHHESTDGKYQKMRKSHARIIGISAAPAKHSETDGKEKRYYP